VCFFVPCAIGLPMSVPTKPARLGVLIVDDHRDTADSLGKVITAWGHQAFVAYDGPTALELARLHHPEVAILDLRMPGMDGFEVAKQLREELGPRAITLVAVTALGDGEALRRTEQAGFAFHLVKPAYLPELRNLLSRF
jgi:CheY-like chemotaxis protein